MEEMLWAKTYLPRHFRVLEVVVGLCQVLLVRRGSVRHLRPEIKGGGDQGDQGRGSREGSHQSHRSHQTTSNHIKTKSHHITPHHTKPHQNAREKPEVWEILLGYNLANVGMPLTASSLSAIISILSWINRELDSNCDDDSWSLCSTWG